MAVYTVEDYVIGILILLAFVWAGEKHLFRKVPFDKKFLLTAAPYAVLGLAVRLLADVGVFEKNPCWNVTPGIYVLSVASGTFFVALGVLVARYTELEYWPLPFFAGTLLASFFTYKLLPHLAYPGLMLYPPLIAASLTAAIYALSAFFKPTSIYRRAENAAIIFAHALDGSATFVGINLLGYVEEHPLPEYLISLAGDAIVMVPLKIIVVLLALYLLESWYEEEGKASETYYKIFKLVFFILGIGPGARDTLLISLA